MKRIYVTLDTEMDSNQHWVKKYPATYTSITEGIPQFFRPIWNKYDVHPIYFVSPEVLYNKECVEVLKGEIARGALIGAHLHPEYIEPNNIFGEGMDKVPPQFPCYGYSDDDEFAKLKNLTELIEKKLGVKPLWYRAARFGADISTMHMLSKLGYQFDSSVTPNIDWSKKGGPDHSRAINRSYWISKDNIYEEAPNMEDSIGIREIPVTVYARRWGIIGKLLPENWMFYRWLRPTCMTYLELKNLIKLIEKEKKTEGVMMFHSMEIMINKTPYVRTQWMQQYYLWRLEKTLEFARKQGYQL